MAERAVHFSVTSQEKPTIFEIIAQDSLTATVHPALKHWVQFLSTINPQYFSKTVIWYDELYLCFSSIIEYYYLTNYGASFAEAFYGLRRICMKNSKIQNGIADLDIRKRYVSLFCLVLLPYCCRKIDKKINEKITENNPENEFLKPFLYTRNILKITWESLGLVQLIAYASGKTIYHSPLLKMFKIAVVYNSQAISSQQWSWSDVWNKKISLATIFGMGFLRSFEVGAFFMQFLQSWTSENSKLDITSLPVPPPPSLDSRAEKYKGKCPICLQVWKAPTALQTSGYVFCYMCIVSFLKNNSCCPITQYPATTDDLVRIFSIIT